MTRSEAKELLTLFEKAKRKSPRFVLDREVLPVYWQALRIINGAEC